MYLGVKMPPIDDFRIKWKCVHCGKNQLVYVGDPADYTIPDREAMRCYACKKVELIVSKEEFLDYHTDVKDVTTETIEKHAFIQDGEMMRAED
jgi:hypothetical protein